MNQLFVNIYRLFKSGRNTENPLDAAENSVGTAAVPGPEEPKELHAGKRRLKENYTSHWDLDYLPRKEVEKIMAEARRKQG